MATFYPRYTRYESGSIQGDFRSLDWYKYVYGTRTFNVPLPNCTTYAYGRTMEQYFQQGRDLSVRTNSYNPYWWNSTGSHYGDAQTWFESTVNTWEKGFVPKLGAIACWGANGLGGHVAIVERINDDGTVDLSESHYGGALFNLARNQRLVVGQMDTRIGGRFQGYIYNTIDYGDSPTPPVPQGQGYLIYRRGSYVKIIGYGRSSSTGRFPIAKGIGWNRQVLRIFKDREFGLQLGDIKTGRTTGYYSPKDVQLIRY